MPAFLSTQKIEFISLTLLMQTTARFPAFPVYKTPLAGTESSFKKDQPYLSDKHDTTLTCENGAHAFKTGLGRQIVCRHFCMQFILDVLGVPKDEVRDDSLDQDKEIVPNGKVAAENFQGEKIVDHVRPETEQLFKNRVHLASDVSLVNNATFGTTLCKMFDQLDRSGKSVGAALLESPSHAMAIRLRIKKDKKTEEKTYVVALYDPNLTGTWVRFAVKESNLGCLWSAALSDLFYKNLSCEGNYGKYFSDSNTSLVTTFDTDKLAGAMDRLQKGLPISSDPVHSGEIIADFTLNTLHPHHIYNLAKTDCFQNIKNIAGDLKGLKLNQEKLFQIIRGCGDEIKKYYALSNALASQAPGAHITIDAYFELFELLPIEKRAKLLKEITDEGLAHAVVANLTKNIEAYGKFLKALPQDKRKAVFEEVSMYKLRYQRKKSDGSITEVCMTSVEAALKANSFDAINAYLKLLPDPHCSIIDPSCLVRLKATFEKVFSDGDLKGICTCAELLKTLPEDKRADLLRGIAGSAVQLALNNNLKLADAYADLLSLIPAADREQFIKPLPLAYMTQCELSVGRAEAFQVLGKLFKLVPKQRLEAVCLPKDTTWQSDLFRAFNYARPESKMLYLELLDNIDPTLTDHFIQFKESYDVMIAAQLKARAELAATQSTAMSAGLGAGQSQDMNKLQNSFDEMTQSLSMGKTYSEMLTEIAETLAALNQFKEAEPHDLGRLGMEMSQG